jgi:cytochrome P450
MVTSASLTAGAAWLPWTDPDLNADPRRVLETLRPLGPVVFNEAENSWLILSYEHCSAILADPMHFSSAGLIPFIMDQFGGLTMEGMDDRVCHSGVRGIWSKEFLRGSLENQREVVTRIVAEQVGGMVARLRDGETVDAVSAATRRIPTLVIAHMLGLDPSAHEEFSAWTDHQIAMVAGSMDPSPEGRALVEAGKAATKQMNQHVAAEIQGRRERDTPDLIGMGARCPSIGADDLIANVTQLVVGGNETTARLMAVSLVVLAQHPEQRRWLATNRRLLRSAIEELLRYETIVQWMARTTLTDVEVAGIEISEGASIACMLGAANRDPARWDAPNDFDIQRRQRAHLGFGTGMHTCLGLNLTRLEMEIFLDYLMTELPDWELAEPPTYGRSFPIRGPEQVIIRT